MKTKQTHSLQQDDQRLLRGLHQAAYVMSCLCEGKVDS